jgi:hypothetical protein
LSKRQAKIHHNFTFKFDPKNNSLYSASRAAPTATLDTPKLFEISGEVEKHQKNQCFRLLKVGALGVEPCSRSPAVEWPAAQVSSRVPTAITDAAFLAFAKAPARREIAIHSQAFGFS